MVHSVSLPKLGELVITHFGCLKLANHKCPQNVLIVGLLACIIIELLPPDIKYVENKSDDDLSMKFFEFLFAKY